MIKNRFQIIEETESGNKETLRGLVFQFYHGALICVGRLARIHPEYTYYIYDKQDKVEYRYSRVN